METETAIKTDSELSRIIEKAEAHFSEKEMLEALDKIGRVVDGKGNEIKDPVKKINFLGPQKLWKTLNQLKPNITPKPEEIKFPFDDFTKINRVINHPEQYENLAED